MSDKKQLKQNRQQVQERLVVWVVLAVCLQVLAMILGWHFLLYVAWLAVAYCLVLIILWCYLTYCLWR